jgi:hypothetical protein
MLYPLSYEGGAGANVGDNRLRATPGTRSDRRRWALGLLELLSYRSPAGEMNLFHTPGGLQTRSRLCCATCGLSPRTSQR